MPINSSMLTVSAHKFMWICCCLNRKQLDRDGKIDMFVEYITQRVSHKHFLCFWWDFILCSAVIYSWLLRKCVLRQSIMVRKLGGFHWQPQNLWRTAKHQLLKWWTMIHSLVNWLFVFVISTLWTKLVWTIMRLLSFGPDEHRKHPDSKVHRANMGPIWGQPDPAGPHVGPMNFAIWAATKLPRSKMMPAMLYFPLLLHLQVLHFIEMYASCTNKYHIHIYNIYILKFWWYYSASEYIFVCQISFTTSHNFSNSELFSWYMISISCGAIVWFYLYQLLHLYFIVNSLKH